MNKDLISREALNDALIDLFQEIDDMYVAGRVISLVNLQPTAYDTDKVVEQLENASCYIEDGDGHAGHLFFTDEAIEILKGGLE